jgi:hypothetical protein
MPKTTLRDGLMVNFLNPHAGATPRDRELLDLARRLGDAAALFSE